MNRRRFPEVATKANLALNPDGPPATPEQLARVAVTSPPEQGWAYERASGR